MEVFGRLPSGSSAPARPALQLSLLLRGAVRASASGTLLLLLLVKLLVTQPMLLQLPPAINGLEL